MFPKTHAAAIALVGLSHLAPAQGATPAGFPLHAAIEDQGDEAAAEALVAERRHNRTVLAGQTPLALAARHGMARVVKALLKAEASDKAGFAAHETQALLAAVDASAHRAEILGTLLGSGYGFPLEARNAAGETPFLAAVRGGDAKATLALLRAGADPRAADAQGRTALHLAVAAAAVGRTGVAPSAREAMVAWLLNVGLDPDAPDADGLRPLHLAYENLSRHGSGLKEADLKPLVTLLLSHGANADARAKDGKTPAERAGKSAPPQDPASLAAWRRLARQAWDRWPSFAYGKDRSVRHDGVPFPTLFAWLRRMGQAAGESVFRSGAHEVAVGFRRLRADGRIVYDALGHTQFARYEAERTGAWPSDPDERRIVAFDHLEYAPLTLAGDLLAWRSDETWQLDGDQMVSFRQWHALDMATGKEPDLRAYFDETDVVAALKADSCLTKEASPALGKATRLEDVAAAVAAIPEPNCARGFDGFTPFVVHDFDPDKGLATLRIPLVREEMRSVTSLAYLGILAKPLPAFASALRAAKAGREGFLGAGAGAAVKPSALR